MGNRGDIGSGLTAQFNFESEQRRQDRNFEAEQRERDRKAEADQRDSDRAAESQRRAGDRRAAIYTAGLSALIVLHGGALIALQSLLVSDEIAEALIALDMIKAIRFYIYGLGATICCFFSRYAVSLGAIPLRYGRWVTHGLALLSFGVFISTSLALADTYEQYARAILGQ